MSQFQMRRFETVPPVLKNIIMANVVVFIAQQVFPWFDRVFALHFYESPFFKPWQVITHIFMHGSIGHLFFNMLALWMFGSILENLWGPKRFLSFYFFCGLAAAVLHTVVMAIQYYKAVNLIDLNLLAQMKLDIKEASAGMMVSYNNYNIDKVGLFLQQITLGASGAIYGVMGAFAYLFPNSILNIYFVIPVKAKYAIIGLLALEFVLGTASIAGDNVAHFAHLGGALFGLFLVYFWNKTNKKTFY